MNKTASKLSSDVRNIYTCGGTEDDIFYFLRTNIEKITKSELSLIATIEYDEIEKYNYLYVNSNTLVKLEKIQIEVNDHESESQSIESSRGIPIRKRTSDSLRSKGSTSTLVDSVPARQSKKEETSSDPEPFKPHSRSRSRTDVTKTSDRSPSLTPRSLTSRNLTESFVDAIRGRKKSKVDSPPKLSTSSDIGLPQRIIKLNNILGRVMKSFDIIIESAFTAADLSVFSAEIKTFMGIPVICSDDIIGIICLANADKYTNKTHEKIMDLIENCTMYMKWFKERKSDIDKKNAIQRIKKNSWDGVIDIDYRGIIIDVNRSAVDIIGYNSRELCGKLFTDLIPSRTMRHGIVDYIKGIFERGDSTDGSSGEGHGNRESVSLETKHKILGDTGELYFRKGHTHGSRTYVTLRFIKLTARTMMIMIRPVDDMVRDKQLAEQSNEYKNMFVANVTHELKTPLNGIIGMGVQLLKTELTEKQRTYCNIILNSGEELSRIIGDILDLSKLEDGKIDIVPRPFSLEDCVTSCHRNADFSIRERNLEYSQYISPRVPDAIIGDSDRIKQIIGNLLSNAVKFTERGSITIRVDALPMATPSTEEFTSNYMVSISVADTGIGIKRSDIAKLFKPFSQLDQGTTKSYKGTGLGLSISQRLAGLMQGTIHVESDYTAGSIFTLKFPAKKHDAILITEEFKLQTIPLFRGRRAIVVDDNSVNRTVVCGILIDWGMEVTTCPTADEALMFVRSGAKFDIGIIDINMPGKDGNQLAQAIRRTNLNLSMIAVSSSGDKQVNLELFDDYCEKPINEPVLIKKMITLFSRPGLKAARPLTERVKKDTMILIVEDNTTNQLVLADKLDELGYKNRKIANDGLEAYNEVKANPRKYKLIFMDIKMPRMDGKEASTYIKNIYGWKDTYTKRKSTTIVKAPETHRKKRSDGSKLQPSKSLSDADIKKSHTVVGKSPSHPLAASAPYKGAENAKYCPFICALSATTVKEEERILLDKLIFDDYITKPIDDNELIRVLNKFE